MKKISLASTLLLGVASFAFAAAFPNVQFDNGDVTISGKGGSTVNATFHVIVPANQVVEWIETDVVSDNLAPVCHEMNDALGLQEGTHDITLPVKLPPNTGTYTLTVKGAGTYGGIRSISCTDNVVGSSSFSGAIRVTAGSGSIGAPTEDSSFTAILALLKDIIGKLSEKVVPVPTPTPNPLCSMYHTAKTGSQYGVKTDANARFQGFLLSQGASIPALSAGASFGFYGSQTLAADTWFTSMNPTCR